ncbi:MULTISPECIES: acetyl-CoA carboxylase, carboxyltransferase subunit beta [Romboutsia]|uniref:Acetyl-coenzyme A carboxylase carboxyl transferase subunit beta n=1 Tax=Romboutsia hominis TaxID=1507512 RepID=A0A2P2BR62_9FIRM|nr:MULTISPECIES: acetyl-CoA carboxylase, carboxyltransferase subunit beta [Romboutsia]MCH1960202.1 acetyl-CoA carboxylase, carboxyltransferase subunit beta [Romboutsia hominis]MCH1969363.1 acetyl-CoA carboxylase, carboxyltransferase subunit beta [Romboutsia hominis]MDB8791770.1 acetyl-CoA carboxylase, carboxyltransferase subunit beta [Romboutsia sp. 1001216sp1]MDB8794107.1 acetyl-CoA carboxylase, carboxyltransferase subunit beta [Romboutsia sp. 1001216sp1]MDB8796347.1 acetyl-CoA carboxylase, c
MIKKFLPSKETKYITVSLDNKFKKNSVDDKFWIYCEGCNDHVFKKDIEDNLNICPKCETHYSIKARDRISLISDNGTFKEFMFKIDIQDPLEFPNYLNKLNNYKEKTKEDEAVICGTCSVNGIKIVLCVMNPDFMMGSMGSIVGDKITYSIEYAASNDLHIIICTASGGARMQEGMVSLMQMAKTSQAISKLEEKGLLYISLLTHPTTGGVSASFAMLGDIILSEPNTLIGFAGKRVIEQTINQRLPNNFQTSEFLLEHGFIDKIVNRKYLKDTLYTILSLH